MPEFVFGGDDIEVRKGLTPRLLSQGTSVEVFLYPDGSSPVVSFRSFPDATVFDTLQVNDNSQLPLFYLPADDRDTIYVRAAGGPIVPIYARVDDRLDVLRSRVDQLDYLVDDAVYDGGSPETIGADVIDGGTF